MRRLRAQGMGQGVVGVVALVGAVWLGLAAFAWLFGERLILPRPPLGYDEGAELTWLQAPSGERLAALWLPREGARTVLLYSHGNYEDLGTIRGEAQRLHRLGYAVLAYDYRGYGLSEGRSSVSGAVEDVEAAYRWLLERGWAAEDIVLYGRSVGGGPTLELAAREPVGGVVLEGTFLTAFRVVTRAPLLPFDHFRNDRNVLRVRAPLLVIHGTRDEVVPFRHGQALYERAPGPKRHLWVEGAGHNDLTAVGGQAYEGALRDFRAWVEQPAEPGEGRAGETYPGS